MSELGNKIKRLRRERKISQDEIAEKLFVSRQTVYRWESGTARPSKRHLEELSELLGAQLRLTAEEEKIPETQEPTGLLVPEGANTKESGENSVTPFVEKHISDPVETYAVFTQKEEKFPSTADFVIFTVLGCVLLAGLLYLVFFWGHVPGWLRGLSCGDAENFRIVNLAGAIFFLGLLAIACVAGLAFTVRFLRRTTAGKRIRFVCLFLTVSCVFCFGIFSIGDAPSSFVTDSLSEPKTFIANTGLYTDLRLRICSDREGKVLFAAENRLTIFPSTVETEITLYSCDYYTENLSEMTPEAEASSADLNMKKVLVATAEFTGRGNSYWRGAVRCRVDRGEWRTKTTDVFLVDRYGDVFPAKK